ncbi:class A beta-lactamase [Polaromonas eurypsychrophila]|uniref:Beta-lactamase n=1 Tax=Polaromonas eurypsychrophila TaxID=1614635 RepID=A0A916SSD6_9BURK|nr:class A beta-lactamase [Polaromonas eurypsychrophila]GGB13857.1 beta-lactamase [Polaromonas eurypsychrophila]
MKNLNVHSPFRRHLLLVLATSPLLSACTATARRDSTTAQARLAALETESGGRLGVFAINTADGSVISHRGDERFPLCSTFKVVASAAVLAQSAREPDLLSQRIKYTRAEMVTYSPITEKHLANGMTVAELCAAAIQYSDNTAGNMLIKILGGPPAVTAYARSIGDPSFRLDRWETELNTAIPGDARDTTTPAAMAATLQKLVLGNTLAPPQRDQLQAWLRGNTTGATRIRAGVPAGWIVGDKTGGGDYGTNNDVAVLWPPGKPPIVLALYMTQREKDAKPKNEVLAEATRVVVGAIGS